MNLEACTRDLAEWTAREAGLTAKLLRLESEREAAQQALTEARAGLSGAEAALAVARALAGRPTAPTTGESHTTTGSAHNPMVRITPAATPKEP